MLLSKCTVLESLGYSSPPSGSHLTYYLGIGSSLVRSWFGNHIRPVCSTNHNCPFYAQERSIERNDHLFRSRKGGYITKQRADQIIKAAGRRANLQCTVHAHLFRHGYAINFLNCSGRLDALQEQLGHRDINTTRIYLRLSDEDLRREVSKLHF